jgi:single-strand DNA-binding protein
MSNVTDSNARKHKNEVHLTGVLARDPEVRYTMSGKAVANFNVATIYEKSTEHHRCTAWEKQAERLGEHFHKGDFIQVVGRLQTRSYEKYGAKKYVTEVVIWNLSDGTTKPNNHGLEVSDADIPF